MNASTVLIISNSTLLSTSLYSCPCYLSKHNSAQNSLIAIPPFVKHMNVLKVKSWIYPFYHPHANRGKQTSLLPGISDRVLLFFIDIVSASFSTLLLCLGTSSAPPRPQPRGDFLEIFLCSTSPCHTPHHTPHIELDSSRCIYCPLLSWWHNLKLLALSVFDSVPMAVSAKGMVLRQPLQCYTYQWRLCRASEAWRISLLQNDLLCPAGHQQWHRRTQCSGPWLPLPCSEYFQSVLGMNTLLGTLTKYQEDAVHFFFWRGFHSRRNTRLVGITVMRP